MPPIPTLPTMSADTEQNFALDRETLERRCQILDLERQSALWLYENLKKKVLEQSGGSVGRTVGAAPEGGPASSSHPVPTPPGPTPHRQQRQRPSISRTPYPTQQNDRRSVLHLCVFERYLRDLALSTALAEPWHHQCWNPQGQCDTTIRRIEGYLLAYSGHYVLTTAPVTVPQYSAQPDSSISS